jgi:hypothetical protein
MRELIPVDEQSLPRTPAILALEDDAPSPSELFAFMSEAELRFESLRMRISDRTWTTGGEATETVEVAMRHPGHARVVRRRDSSGLSRDYDVWVADGEVVRTYDARSRSGSVRPMRQRVVGATDPGLPSFARVWVPRIELPPKTLADSFIHPRGFCRNVLSTGPVTILGGARLAGDREVILLRSDHPRTSHVLTDRPDRWLEVGVDRMTGLIVLLIEHVADRVTRHAEVTDLELDPVLPDEMFTVHLSEDTRMLY